MPRADTCHLKVSVEDALTLRNLEVKKKLLEFRCVECGKPVRPFSASADSAAHFEHFKRNPNCSLSDPAR
jgi:hypothetical protein